MPPVNGNELHRRKQRGANAKSGWVAPFGLAKTPGKIENSLEVLGSPSIYLYLPGYNSAKSN